MNGEFSVESPISTPFFPSPTLAATPSKRKTSGPPFVLARPPRSRPGRWCPAKLEESAGGRIFLLLGKKWGKGESFLRLLQEAAADATQKRPHPSRHLLFPFPGWGVAGQQHPTRVALAVGGHRRVLAFPVSPSLSQSGLLGRASSSEPPCGRKKKYSSRDAQLSSVKSSLNSYPEVRSQITPLVTAHARGRRRGTARRAQGEGEADWKPFKSAPG